MTNRDARIRWLEFDKREALRIERRKDPPLQPSVVATIRDARHRHVASFGPRSNPRR
jgi:hypothetical protein